MTSLKFAQKAKDMDKDGNEWSDNAHILLYKKLYYFLWSYLFR